MRVGGPLGWSLTAGFGIAAAIYGALAATGPRYARRRIRDGLHALMCMGMVAMVWPSGVRVPTVGYIGVFGAATGWCLWDALSPAVRPDGRRRHGVVGPWYHVAMMLAMVWMAVAIATMDGSPMSDMHVAGHDMSSGPAPMGMSLPLWVLIPSAVLAVGFGIAALFLARSALVPEAWTKPRRVFVAGMSTLTAAGMALAFALMVWF